MTSNYKKIEIAIFAVVLLVAVFSIVLFLYVFHQHELSNDLKDWSYFGSYIGGVMTPLALIVAIGSFLHQHRSSIKAGEQVLASGVLNSLERLEARMDAELKDIEVRINYPDMDNYNINTHAFFCLTNKYAFNLEKAIPRFIDNEDELTAFLKNMTPMDKMTYIQFLGLFAEVAGNFQFMKSLIQKHVELSGTNHAAVLYRKKYKIGVARLIEQGYEIDPWDDISKI